MRVFDRFRIAHTRRERFNGGPIQHQEIDLRKKITIYEDRNKEPHEIRRKHCLHLPERVHIDRPVAEHKPKR
jgi:hypothetical protein